MSIKAEIEITCPSCGNLGETSGRYKSKKCFYNADKDVWHCYHCSAKGKGNPMALSLITNQTPEFQFTEDLLIAYQEELKSSPEAQAYLSKRFGGIEVTDSIFELGYDSGRNAIVIPVRGFNGDLIGVKYRYLSDEGSRYISEPGSKAGLYVLKGQPTSILFVEGEFDAMSAYLMGFEGLIVAVQTNRVNQAVKDKLTTLINESIQRIYIAADKDQAGQLLVETIQQLDVDKAKICLLNLNSPEKDLSAILQTSGLETAETLFKEAMSKAKTELELSTFCVFDRIQQTLEYLQDENNTTGITTGFQLLDKHLGGGWMPHLLTAFSAPAKTGKTSVLIQLIFNLISRNTKVGFISLEMDPPTHVIPSLFSIAAQKNIRRLSKEAVTKEIADLQTTCPYLNNLSFFDRYGATPSEEIFEWISYQYSQGVTVFFLDHVGYSLVDIKDINEHSRLSKGLRKLTRELPIHIVAIVQPKQLQAGVKMVTKHDLYGSVTWSQDVNQLITLERSGDNQVTLRLTDSHNPLARPQADGLILFYSPETCTLSE